MKISKLFHSLYALLMLAPVFAVGGAMAFNIINDKAVDNAQNNDIHLNNITYQYETNEVIYNNGSLDTSSILNNHFYLMTFRNITGNSSNTGGQFLTTDASCISFLGFDFPVDYDIVYRTSIGLSSGFMYVGPVITISQSGTISSNSNLLVYLGGEYIADNGSYSLPVLINDKSKINFNNTYLLFEECPLQYIPYTLEEVNITYPDNLSDNFYYALDSMNNSEVFSWAKTSFLAEPFSYIFGLFGIPSGSPFITLLSYWLSISIIWLVFDLVMYLPLLVHGWIDKGGIE